MKTCQSCNGHNEDDATFCKHCGTRLSATGNPMGGAPSPQKKKFFMYLPMALLLTGLPVYFFLGKGCSSVEGSLVASGNPLGSFTFTPAQCRSGQRMQFFGAVLLGKGQTDGAVVPFFDPVKGKLVKIEIPGSCKAPDYEECTEVIVEKSSCTTYKIDLVRTSTEVNDIRLIDGALELDCTFPEGGTLKGKMKFESCD